MTADSTPSLTAPTLARKYSELTGREQAALSFIAGYLATQSGQPTHPTPDMIDSRTLTSLMDQGLVERHPEWSGCIQATEQAQSMVGFSDWRQVTDKDITELHDEAAVAGDHERVAICDRALAGDDAARVECERVIGRARASA